MSENSMLDQFKITVDGQTPSAALERSIIEVVIDDSLHLPDMFSIRVQDPDLEWVDSDWFKIGAQVEIYASAASQGTRSGAEGQLIQGEITAISPNFSQTGEAMLVIQGYDRSHRLHRGKKSRSFIRVTDLEIVERIAREARLKVNSLAAIRSGISSNGKNPATVLHDYVFQDNRTDLEFLQLRAQRIGFQVFVKDKTLYYGQMDSEQNSTVELEWGKNLRSFVPRMTTMNQVDEVEVRGWDPKTKGEIVSRAFKGSIGPKVGISQNGSDLTQKAFGIQTRMVIVDQPVASIDEANSIAQSMRDEISADFIKAEGVTFGDPRVAAGAIVDIGGVGNRFGGSYFVTSSTHVLNQEGYYTYFNISGRKPDTLSYLLQSDSGGGKKWHIVIGIVTNNRDPEGWGRVKVRFPWLAESEESTWARMAMPMGGANKGMFFLPEINDEVLIGFEHGDINHPYVLGVLWNGKDKPPLANNEVVGRDGKVNRQVLRSRSGHEIILDDTRGREKIIIRDQNQASEIVFDSRNNAMLINVKGNLSIEANGELLLKGRKVIVSGDTIELN